MKKTLIAAALLAAVCAALSAQTDTDDARGGEAALPPLIHNYQGWNWPYRPARLLDGSAEGRVLTFKESLKTLSVVPENAALVKRAKGWFAASNIFYGVFMAGLVGGAVFAFDVPYRDSGYLICLGTEAAGLLFQLVFWNNYHINFSRAMDNYNLYIQGIPIPAGK
jgi:hypothetical protein